jgi:hypothetical protein
MRVRWIGPALALALVGGAVGFAAGTAALDDPSALSGPQPVPAVSPSYPVNEYAVLPDPGIAPLAPDLPLRTARLRAGGLPMTASVPVGWRRVALQGRDSWNFADPDNPPNTYLLRIGIDAGDRVSLTVARESRITALEDAETNGAVEHLVIEERVDDGFTATYLDDSHQRVTMERWLPQPDSDQAFAAIAVTGREADRAGLADLLERVSASAVF